MRRVAILAACFTLLTMPTAQSGEPRNGEAKPGESKIKTVVQKQNDEWAAAFNSGDAAAIAEMYVKDAYVMPPGSDIIQGQAAIEAWWRSEMKEIGDVKITTLDARQSGPTAREIGKVTFRTKAQPPQEGELKYAVFWQKEEGRWKLAVDIWNVTK